MRYTGPAFLHLTEDEVATIVKHLPESGLDTLGYTQQRMRAWLTYRRATTQLHGDNRETSWNQQTRSHDA